MAVTPVHQIRYPDRAESLNDFVGYKVFFDHWKPVAMHLTALYEGLKSRKETRVLAIHAEQGGGKTLLARKLKEDFAVTVSHPNAAFDSNNLWHQMVAWRGGQSNLAESTQDTEVFVSGDDGWKGKVEEWLQQRPNRRCVVIVDEADQARFRKDLVSMTDLEYAQHGEAEGTLKIASQNFVRLCRNQLRGCLFVLLSNNRQFLQRWQQLVDEQHSGLITVLDLPMPDAKAKEAVVRININRLNEVSYWYCLDKAGPEKKKNVYDNLLGATTFPSSFAAVNDALQTADAKRIGRPAAKCVLTLLILHNQASNTTLDSEKLGTVARVEFDETWMRSTVYDSGWATRLLPEERGAELLESEFDLRVVLFGEPFAKALLESPPNNACEAIFVQLKNFLGPGTHQSTRTKKTEELKSLIAAWPLLQTNTAPFWSAGQVRSIQYESSLKAFLDPFDVGGNGFLTYRPDYIVSAYVPCSILTAGSSDDSSINAAIKRNGHVFEFTAIANPSLGLIDAYLKSKLNNYIEVVQEQ